MPAEFATLANYPGAPLSYVAGLSPPVTNGLRIYSQNGTLITTGTTGGDVLLTGAAAQRFLDMIWAYENYTVTSSFSYDSETDGIPRGTNAINVSGLFTDLYYDSFGGFYNEPGLEVYIRDSFSDKVDKGMILGEELLVDTTTTPDHTFYHENRARVMPGSWGSFTDEFIDRSETVSVKNEEGEVLGNVSVETTNTSRSFTETGFDFTINSIVIRPDGVGVNFSISGYSFGFNDYDIAGIYLDNDPPPETTSTITGTGTFMGVQFNYYVHSEDYTGLDTSGVTASSFSWDIT